MSADGLTVEDREFLRRPLYGFLSVAAGPRPPQPRPVWFDVADDGTVQLFTGPDTAKMRRDRIGAWAIAALRPIRSTPRAAIGALRPIVSAGVTVLASIRCRIGPTC